MGVSFVPPWKSTVTCTTPMTLNIHGQEKLGRRDLLTELGGVPRTPLPVQVSKAQRESQGTGRMVFAGTNLWQKDLSFRHESPIHPTATPSLHTIADPINQSPGPSELKPPPQGPSKRIVCPPHSLVTFSPHSARLLDQFHSCIHPFTHPRYVY